MKDTKHMDGIETIAYWCMNILTLGAPWIMKIIIKKAIIEAHNA